MATTGPAVPVLSPARFYVLGLFVCLMANQCLVWFTFSSVPDLVPRYYCGGLDSCGGMSVGVVDRLLNWGPITFVPIAPFASWLLSFPGGLRRAMQLAALLNSASTLLRLVPSWCLAGQGSANEGIFALLHLAQIINGIAGPILIAGPSRLSALWFPPGQRTLVTAVANASLLGVAVGFVAGPAITDGEPQKLPHLLFVTFALSLPPLVCALAYCPERPARLPSVAVAHARGAGARACGSPCSNVMGFLSEAWTTLLQRPTMVLLMLTTGLGVGVYDGWLGLLPQILGRSPAEFAMQPSLAGACGASSTISCLLGMWVAGAVADQCFARRLKALLLGLTAASALAFAWLAMSLRNAWAPRVLSTSTFGIFVAVDLASFLRTATVPVLYELAAEVAYPQPEGTSAGMIVFSEHAALLCILFVAPTVHVSYITLATLVSLGLCPIVLALAREEYPRRDADEALAAASLTCAHAGVRRLDC